MKKALLTNVLSEIADHVREDGEEAWTLRLGEQRMKVYTSLAKDRLRVMAPVGFLGDLSREQLEQALISNLHADARYGVQDGKVLAVYLHPLSTLTDTDLRSGVRQVAKLMVAAATRFDAGGRRFAWPRPEPHTDKGGVRVRTLEGLGQSVPTDVEQLDPERTEIEEQDTDAS